MGFEKVVLDKVAKVLDSHMTLLLKYNTMG